jgi:hypothetical protein
MFPPLPPIDAKAGSSPSPRCFQSASRKSPGTSAARKAAVWVPPCRDQQAEDGGAEEERVGRLEPDHEAADEPGEDGIRPVACVERSDEEPGGDEHENGRWEVREDGQAERLRQRDVDVLLVVALVEHRNGGVGDADPECGRPVAEHASAMRVAIPYTQSRRQGRRISALSNDHPPAARRGQFAPAKKATGPGGTTTRSRPEPTGSVHSESRCAPSSSKDWSPPW